MWFERFIEEDVGFGDITSDLLLGEDEIIGTIFAKEDCILAGLEEVIEIFEFYNIECNPLAKDGDKIHGGSDVLEIRGSGRDILMLERVVLNILGHMSGVATKARKMVEKARKINPNVRVAITRKTLPGLRKLEKKAAAIGGADTHRLRLDDHILIKDNHLAVVGNIQEAINRAKNASFVRKIEIECESIEDALLAAEEGADIVMLDNMSPADAKKAYEEIKKRFPSVIIEISGGINEENIEKYAKYADVISSGSVTHSAPSVDFSMEVELTI